MARPKETKMKTSRKERRKKFDKWISKDMIKQSSGGRENVYGGSPFPTPKYHCPTCKDRCYKMKQITGDVLRCEYCNTPVEKIKEEIS